MSLRPAQDRGGRQPCALPRADLDVVTGATPPTANKTLAYAGHVNSNPGGDCGELHIEVTEGTCQTNSTVTLSGRLKLVKDGAGTLVCAKTGQTYGGALIR